MYTKDFNESEFNMQLYYLANDFLDLCLAACKNKSINLDPKILLNYLHSLLTEYLNLHIAEFNSDEISLQEYLELKFVHEIIQELVNTKTLMGVINISK